MPTIQKQLKLLLTVAVFVANSIAYDNAAAESATQQDPAAADHSSHGSEWPGVYYGFLPCEDCNGVKTSLALNANNTYLMMTQNVGKSLREFTEKGKFIWLNDNTIELTPRNSKVSRQYHVGDNRLVQIDPDTGRQSETLILNRTDVTSKPPKHVH